MKPFTSGAVIASWLLRIVLIWFVYQNYFKAFTEFDFKDLNFYISAAYLVFTLLLVIGGLAAKTSLTVISGLIILILPVIQFIRIFPGDIFNTFLNFFIPLSIGFKFFTSGNE